ncbi:glycosyltransferase [Tropicimonas sp. TH_r6]|uniref:glycosyltransferase n=1 Tax=Tropicimonas sp. TH_r6 TaxID=3082085 RepID=UPI002953E28A|nr:glycosyltransferase [Tropicimonas sp. TH_r6]MDV7141407.1 glycosyltransferase [Tropicimonas sp. TH_r6]
MTSTKNDIVDWVFKNGSFDPEWYGKSFPDVGALDLEPEQHYRRFGALMKRPPNARFAADPTSFLIAVQGKPKENHELLVASRIAQDGDHDIAVRFAETYVPEDMAYAIETLRANRALATGDSAGWLRHLNSYIGRFGAAPVQMGAGGQLLDRLSTGPLPAVTGGPLVSVIMPAWNAEKSIRPAVASILRQTWRNLELLIVDDASEDGTWGILQEIAASDSRVKIFRNKVNVGPYVAKNIMVSMASGDWITGHDADDWAHPQRLEHHLGAVLKSPTPPRASLPLMLRLLPDGSLDRFTPISHFSIDGIAREAPIACVFNAGFLRDDLGSWDCVRFGADSEMIGRARKLLGDECRSHDQIAMFAMSFEDSLTNHATHGVSRTTGPSQIRKDYAAAWRNWHKTIDADRPGTARLPFPPEDASERPFAASPEALVPLCNVRRNHAAMTGDGIDDISVTVLCPSKRPGFLGHISAQIRSQVHPNLHVVFVAHGPGHDPEEIRRSFAGVASVTVIELPDPDVTLGVALNLALEQCQSDLVAKIDDDDFYGPNYIRSSLATFLFNGHDDVGIVGRNRAFCYVEDTDAFVLRFKRTDTNVIKSRVFGGTIFWSRQKLQDQKFQDLPRAIDTAFFKDAEEKGVKIFSGEPEDYVHVRYSLISEHTWKASVEDFLRPTTELAKGLRLDLAWSSQRAPEIAELPKHPVRDENP